MPIDGVLIEFQGKIYVADGTLFFCYNPDNNSWSAKANISTDDKPWLAKTEDRLFAIESNWAIHQYEENQNKWTTVWIFPSTKQICFSTKIVYPNFRLDGSVILERSRASSAIATKSTFCARLAISKFWKRLTIVHSFDYKGFHFRIQVLDTSFASEHNMNEIRNKDANRIAHMLQFDFKPFTIPKFH